MNKVKLTIKEHGSGVDFQILNLDKLDTKTVEELKNFALKRNGYFRHDLARFDIKRKLTQKQILQIFELLEITADVIEDDKSSVEVTPASQRIIDFGKYKGFLWSDVPLSYLEWIYKENENIYALSEIKRRENTAVNIENEIIKFGKFKGQQWIKLPNDYLAWLLNQFSKDKEAHKFAKLVLEYKENN